VVTDHRMVFSISKERTILWDQFRYQGDPSEFAWVLPVRAGAEVELSTDAWITALDNQTQPQILQPPRNFSGGGTERSGCGCSSVEYESATASKAGDSPVQVVSQKVVGPYETVTLRSKEPDALSKWLLGRGFRIPKEVEPVIAAYR
jgi:hypothetical protein